MFIDYITLLLINTVAGLLVLALYLVFALGSASSRAWAPAFAAVGLVGLLAGAHMTVTWPVTQMTTPDGTVVNLRWANIAYGELSMYFAAVYLVAALALGLGWSLVPTAVVGAVGAAVSVLVGVRIASLELTQSPTVSAAGFILTGAAGLLVLPALLLGRSLWLRLVAAAALVVSAGIWALTGLTSYWMHMGRFSGPMAGG